MWDLAVTEEKNKSSRIFICLLLRKRKMRYKKKIYNMCLPPKFLVIVQSQEFC